MRSVYLTDYAQGYQWGNKGIVDRESVYGDGEISVLKWGNSCIGRQDCPALQHFGMLDMLVIQVVVLHILIKELTA